MYKSNVLHGQLIIVAIQKHKHHHDGAKVIRSLFFSLVWVWMELCVYLLEGKSHKKKESNKSICFRNSIQAVNKLRKKTQMVLLPWTMRAVLKSIGFYQQSDTQGLWVIRLLQR